MGKYVEMEASVNVLFEAEISGNKANNEPTPKEEEEQK